MRSRSGSRPWCRSRALFALAAAAAVAVLPAGLAGQTIRGVVLEGGSTAPVVGATIEVLRADSTRIASVTSDRQGWFQVKVKSEGRYLLLPSHPSYQAMRADTVRVGRHEIVTVILHMGPAAIPLEALVVTARSRDALAGFYERSETQRLGKFIHRDFIERRVAMQPSNLLRMTPGIRIVKDSSGLSNLVMMRGDCMPEVFLDGLPVAQNLGMSIDELTAADLLEGVEIYDSYAVIPRELPVYSHPCGVVAFWSRRDVHTRVTTWHRIVLGLAAGAAILLSAL